MLWGRVRKNWRVLLCAILCVTFFLSGLFAKAVGANYRNAKYNCSFSVSGSDWKGSDKITISAMRDGEVEYFNTKTFSTVTFAIMEYSNGKKETARQQFLFNRTRMRRAKETFVSMLRSRSDRVWAMRSDYLKINGMECYKSEVGYMTNTMYVGVVVFFIYKNVQYRFFFSALESRYRSEYPGFMKILSSFKVN